MFEKFRDLLEFNNRVLELIVDMGDKLSGDYVFDNQYLEATVSEIEDLVRRIIYNLNTITGNRYPALTDAFEHIQRNIRAELTHDQLPSRRDLVISLEEADLDLVELVGAKMGTLGEIRSRLGQRVPPGFVITTNAYRRFVDQKVLAGVLSEADEELDAGGDPGMVSERILAAVKQARIPERLDRAMKQAARRLEEEGYGYFAVRSSAIGEDTELSYA
ncbi:MAG: PEP/pyruvate-binding domain-containing protein, partial [Thermodesulfobacteriota bacterium]